MTIQNEFNRLESNFTSLKTALTNAGVQTPTGYSDVATKIDAFPNSIYKLSMDHFVDYNSYGNYKSPSKDINARFDGLKRIAVDYALAYTFYDTDYLKSIEFPDLEIINGKGCLLNICNDSENCKKALFPKLKTISGELTAAGMFIRNTTLDEIDFSNLETIDGRSAFSSSFYQCTKLAGTLNLSKLKHINDYEACYQTFAYCTKITSVDLSGLESIGGSGIWTVYQMFVGDTGITSVDLSSLREITGNACLDLMFQKCTGLTRIDFPSLTTFTSNNAPFGNNGGEYTFRGCTNLTEIHFKSTMQSTISSKTGYSDKFGATNATIYFDL